MSFLFWQPVSLEAWKQIVIFMYTLFHMEIGFISVKSTGHRTVYGWFLTTMAGHRTVTGRDSADVIIYRPRHAPVRYPITQEKYVKKVRCPGDFQIRRWFANRWNRMATVSVVTIAYDSKNQQHSKQVHVLLNYLNTSYCNRYGKIYFLSLNVLTSIEKVIPHIYCFVVCYEKNTRYIIKSIPGKGQNIEIKYDCFHISWYI